MQKQTTHLRGVLAARDLREIVACAIVVVIFGYFYFTVYREPISRLGDLIIIGSTVFIAWRILHTRRATPPAPPGSSIVESLRAELNSTRAQSRLLGSVFWWYLLPPGIGLLVATWGLRINLHAKIVSTLVFVGVDIFVLWLNRWARSTQLLPAETQLESLIHSLETGAPFEEAHTASLRPVLLSMAAANQVKPAEFKVAFWQLALYGEIGFVGIWLCLMLGLGSGRVETSMPNGPIHQAFTQSLPPGETNRYSVVAQKIVLLLNAGDYAGLQRLYNSDMSQAFPPKETSDFYTRLAAGFGRIENVYGPTGKGYQGWAAFQLHGERGELTMSLALDEGGKVAGIYFQPTASPPLTIYSATRRILSWRSLGWLPVFFLAGLFFARLLQKGTERAVGISALGVHLHKGQKLLLWQEIDEIRPLRVLNILSLWLIRQSGEKTIMPWTSLERHPELKAAVEGFAPPNHPLRKYLSLLSRT